MFADVSSCGRWRVLLISGAVLVLAGSASFAGGQSLEEFDADYLQPPADGPNLSAAEELIIRHTNEFRQQQGREPVEADETLTEAARYFAAYMARTDEYGHQADGNQPSQRVRLFGYEFCIVGENIAMQFDPAGFEAAELGERLHTGWVESPEHRQNMLNPHVTEIGVAIGHSPETGQYYAVQIFARPQDAAIRFQVANRTAETLRYTVAATNGDAEAQPRTFELPPRATMNHVRCRPATIDWQWSDAPDKVEVTGGEVLEITPTEGGYQVAERAEPMQ